MTETPAQQPAAPETWEVTWSPSIAKLVDALAKAQLQFQPVFKHNENEAFKRGGKTSRYADLATYIDATQKPLAENGLVVLQWPDVSPEAKSMSLVSILAHSSGEWMRGKLTLPAIGRDGFTAQSCGSSITYARRYSYAAITGCASWDDDGNFASGRGTKEAAEEVARKKIEEHESKQDQRRIVFLKTMPNSDIAVSGYTAELEQFLTDCAATRKKSAKDGGVYWQIAPNYLGDFKTLCERMEIEVA